jgi:hypothetical protein
MRASLVSSACSRPSWWASARRVTHSAAVAKATRCPAWHARMARPVARWVLPVPGGPRKTTFSFAVTKSRVPRGAMTSRLRPRAWPGVELLQALAGREASGPDTPFPAVGLPGGDLALETGHQVLLVRPGLGAGALGQPGDGLAQRRCLERPGQECHFDGQIPAGLGGGLGAHQATPPWPVLTPSAVS